MQNDEQQPENMPQQDQQPTPGQTGDQGQGWGGQDQGGSTGAEEGQGDTQEEESPENPQQQ